MSPKVEHQSSQYTFDTKQDEFKLFPVRLFPSDSNTSIIKSSKWELAFETDKLSAKEIYKLSFWDCKMTHASGVLKRVFMIATHPLFD